MSGLLSHQTRKPSRKPGLHVETLEDRQVLSTLSVDPRGLLTYTAGAGVANNLTITLDQATDNYKFSDVEAINAPGFLGNGTTRVSVPNSRVNAMRILLGDAADTLTVEATRDPIQVQAGTGDDTIILVSTGGTLDGIQAALGVVGEDGTDTLTINDQGAASGKNYALSATSLTRGGITLLQNYATLEKINLNTTGLNDTISVRSTAAGTPVTVNAGFGDDVVTAGGGSGGLDGILSPLQINGQEGRDVLSLDDTGSGAARTFGVTSSGVSHSASSGFSFLNFVNYIAAEGVVINAGAFDDTFNVQGTLAGTPVTLNTGAGNDAVNVGSNPFNPSLDPIQGALTVNGQAGSDVLTLSDMGSTVGRTYTVTSTSVSRSGAALITYGSIESVAINATATADVFYVKSTAAGTSVTLHEGSGNDRVGVGSHADDSGSFPTSTLDLIQGPLTIDGGAPNFDGTEGIDSIELHDEGNRSGQTFTVTSTGVSRSGMAPITFSFQDNVTLNAGGFNDVVNVRSTVIGTVVYLNLGKGDDMVNVGNQLTNQNGSTLDVIQGTFTVQGGDGKDTMNLNDQGGSGTLSPHGREYGVEPDQVTLYGQTSIEFNGLEGLVLNASVYYDFFEMYLGGGPLGPAITINAGDGADRFDLLVPGNAPNPDPAFRFPLTINGQGGTDLLNYGYINIGVRVNLALGTATYLASISGIENVEGGFGDDILIGDAGANILWGSGGRDLLIGGGGPDQLLGGDGENLLIGNGTVYDANAVALEAILAEWGRTDLAYAQRIQHLKFGGGINGVFRLDQTKLVEDNAQDRLTGDAGSLDWFFLTGNDVATDLNQPNFEQVN
jgi:hypothetical protein